MREQIFEYIKQDFIPVRTKTGKEIHACRTGSSVTLCGHWMKINGKRMYVNTQITCEKCIILLSVIK